MARILRAKGIGRFSVELPPRPASSPPSLPQELGYRLITTPTPESPRHSSELALPMSVKSFEKVRVGNRALSFLTVGISPLA